MWTDESQVVIVELKKYIVGTPLLAKPKSGEVLHLYLAVSEAALGVVLMRKETKV